MNKNFLRQSISILAVQSLSFVCLSLQKNWTSLNLSHVRVCWIQTSRQSKYILLSNRSNHRLDLQRLLISSHGLELSRPIIVLLARRKVNDCHLMATCCIWYPFRGSVLQFFKNYSNLEHKFMNFVYFEDFIFRIKWILKYP